MPLSKRSGIDRRLLSGLLALVTLSVSTASAQTADPEWRRWTFRTRAVLSGNSYESEPEGFTAFSGIGLEAAVTRDLRRCLSLETSLRTESREFDRDLPNGTRERLGSLELLPVTVTVQYRPKLGGGIQPYAGAGANLTVAWEKSGVLDSLDVGAHLGPALQAGVDFGLGGAALLNFDLRWNTLTTDITDGDTPYAKVKIDPITLGIGVGFRF